MTKARELAELARTISDSSDALAISIDSSENTTFAGKLTVSDGGNATVAAIGFNAGLGISSPSTDQLNFITDDATRVIIDSAGKVGIGGTPTYTLDVLKDSHNGTIAQFGGNGGDGSFTDVRIRNTHQTSGSTNEGARLIFELGSTNAAWLEAFKEADGTSAGNRTGGLAFYTTASNSTTEKMRIDSSGNVAIGTTDTSIYNGVGLKIANATAARLLLQDSTNGVGATDGLAITAAGTDTYVWNQESGFLSLGTSANERLHIAATGQVGIGISPTSTYRVSIKGDYSSIIGGIEFDTGGGDKFKVGHVSATSPSGEVNVVGSANLIFKTNNTERARFTSAGYFGVGHDSPASGLHLKGANNTASKFTMTNTASANTWSIHPAYNNQDLHFMEDANTRVTFEEGGNVGIGDSNPTQKLTVAGNMNVASGYGYMFGNGQVQMYSNQTYLRMRTGGVDKVAITGEEFQLMSIDRVRINAHSIGNIASNSGAYDGGAPAAGIHTYVFTTQGNNTWRTVLSNFTDSAFEMVIALGDAASRDIHSYSGVMTSPAYGVSSFHQNFAHDGGWNTGSFSVQIVNGAAGNSQHDLQVKFQSYYNSNNMATGYIWIRRLY